jgi:predicted GNAT superfamily acetyltransferase
MVEVFIRDAVEEDYDRIIVLNDAVVQQTSSMDHGRLRMLHRLASYHKVAVVHEQVAGFLLAMSGGVDYPNDNYAWFSARYPRFIYVDRIVVADDYSGLRIGSKLYEDLFEFAAVREIITIACEYNLKPPNPASKGFHDKFGFSEVGTQWVANKTKLVSLQIAET